MSKEKVTYTPCQGWGCHEHCILTTYTEDGKVKRTERTILKGPFAQRYQICSKGIETVKTPYVPDRPLYPLKRVGERGEGKFERISWEQALDEIGEKLNQIKDKYGSRSIVVNMFPCGLPLLWQAMDMLMMYRFVYGLDATMFCAPHVDQSGINMPAIDYGNSGVAFSQDNGILAESHYIIIWAGSPIGWTRPAGTTKILMDVQEKGGKLINIGVAYDSNAAKVDEFIPINPGTDAAMALAMANVMIQEGLCDEDFLIHHTVAPFLVREDNGKFLRESDIVKGGDPQKYVFWNKVPAKPISIESHEFNYGDNYPDLNADLILDGIRCKTAFWKLKEHVAKWTPESQEAITGVPAQKVYDLTHEYIAQKPSTIYIYLGLRYMNSTQAARCVGLLPVLSGNLPLRGGGFVVGSMPEGHLVALNDAPVMMPEMMPKGDAQQLISILDSFKDPNAQQYKAFINPFANPVQNMPNRQLWEKEFFPNMELVVVNEIRMTDTAKFADYVLPEATVFEREELFTIGDCLILSEAAIEPQGEAKEPVYIWSELAKRVGIGQYFDKTTEEWFKIRLQSSDPAIAEVKPPITLERLRKEKIIHLNLPDEVSNFWDNLDFGTPSGRMEFYCEGLADAGGAIGSYIEPQIRGPLSKKYPLQYYPGRHRFFMQGQFSEYADLRALAGKVATVALNPKTARERGIKEGDLVDVFNHRGSVRAVAHLSEMFPPGMAHLWYAYPAKDYPSDPPTALSSANATRECEDEVGKKFGEVWLKQNIEMGNHPTLMFPPGSWTTNETFWDDVCEVRKVEGGK